MSWKEKWISHPHPALIGLVFIASVVMLWWGPAQSRQVLRDTTIGTFVQGEVAKVISEDAVAPQPGSRTTLVQQLLVRTDTGKDVKVHNDLTPLHVGDNLYLNVSLAGTDQESYSIVDYKRVTGLMWLAVAFVALVMLVSGKKGINALVGLIYSVAIIFSYVVPAIVRGVDPVIVGLTAAVGILVGTLYVSYGFNRKSLAALIGIVITLTLVGVVGQYVVGELRFTGYSDEASLYLNAESQNTINLVGLVIAGIIIAAIGVLDDVAITQASTVYELARAGQTRGWQLFHSAMKVGQDHISAVINTLVLAYAGAALPLILLLHMSSFPLSFSIGGEIVAEEIVRTLVSSMGLIVAVPLTTAVAVLFVQRSGVQE